jgi:hypothetical protein
MTTTVAPHLTPWDDQPGYQGRWLVLVGEELVLHLFAMDVLVLGKLARDPVHVSARLYPEDQQGAACRRISRTHCRVLADRASGRVLIEDLGSMNGTVLDGRRLARETPVPIPTQRDSELVLSDVLRYVLRPQGRPRTPWLQAPPASWSGPASVTLARPANRPHLVAALVWDATTIGGDGAGIALPGLEPVAHLGVMYHGGCWRCCRPCGSWQGLHLGMILDMGGHQVIAHLGDHAFWDEQQG